MQEAVGTVKVNSHVIAFSVPDVLICSHVKLRVNSLLRKLNSHGVNTILNITLCHKHCTHHNWLWVWLINNVCTSLNINHTLVSEEENTVECIGCICLSYIEVTLYNVDSVESRAAVSNYVITCLCCVCCCRGKCGTVEVVFVTYEFHSEDIAALRQVYYEGTGLFSLLHACCLYVCHFIYGRLVIFSCKRGYSVLYAGTESQNSGCCN